MGDEILYFEEQSRKPWWLLLILIIVDVLMIYGCIQQLILGQPWGNNPVGDGVLVALTIFVLALTVIFFFVKLKTWICKEGIYMRYFPLVLKTKFFDWDSIDSIYVRQYSPVKEYGGWGYRFGLGKSVAFNVSGNVGLQLILKNGKRVLIGTRKPDEINDVLLALGIKTGKEQSNPE
ncbi:MAG: DUF6141 family protein [Paludibacteraceae bacterium]